MRLTKSKIDMAVNDLHERACSAASRLDQAWPEDVESAKLRRQKHELSTAAHGVALEFERIYRDVMDLHEKLLADYLDGFERSPGQKFDDLMAEKKAARSKRAKSGLVQGLENAKKIIG